MGISDRLGQLLTGARQADEEERLLRLYWNRAELKKELSRLQEERHELIEELKRQEAELVRAGERLAELELHLGDPDVAAHALVYFQLRALWSSCAARLARFSLQLQSQQQDRERRRQLIEFDQTRRRQVADLDRRISEARTRAEQLEAQLKQFEAQLVSRRGFWNYSRRRKLAEQIEDTRSQWDESVTRVTDLSDDRADAEEQQPPAFAGISIDGRRVVNTAVIAYAQQLVGLLSSGGLAMLAKEATSKTVFDLRYGSPEDCVKLMGLLREAKQLANRDSEDLGGLKEYTDALRARATYRSDADTTPLTDSIGTLSLPAFPVSGLESINRTGINVLVDDYWDVYAALLK
ncbi:hypothetical protein [Povalibacter sp.]|uniref:hypothetical protein n=1 Tax=Povalibacter sp. TaxID=1962978 RepID=UPI002F3E96DB